jgi:hypothetical protein
MKTELRRALSVGAVVVALLTGCRKEKESLIVLYDDPYRLVVSPKAVGGATSCARIDAPTGSLRPSGAVCPPTRRRLDYI